MPRMSALIPYLLSNAPYVCSYLLSLIKCSACLLALLTRATVFHLRLSTRVPFVCLLVCDSFVCLLVCVPFVCLLVCVPFVCLLVWVAALAHCLGPRFEGRVTSVQEVHVHQ